MNIVIKNLTELTTRTTHSLLSKTEKERIVTRNINPTKYNLLGFVDRTNDALLEARYYNVRDRRGRFARVRQTA
jgi:hypothetical protein